MPIRVPWSTDDLLVAFRLYCRTPFGRLHGRNPEIVDLARLLGRTPSAVAMKACNFASLDPAQQARNVVALGNVSRGDREVWDAFRANPEAVAAKAEAAHAAIMGRDAPAPADEPPPGGPTEVLRTVRARRVQGFFRAAVLTSYRHRCALSGLDVPDLLNASHIIPWAADTGRRADPRNGIALNALYDRAFDRGLITFDDSLRVVVSKRLKGRDAGAIAELDGRELRLPYRFMPDSAALAYHRAHVFA